MNTLSRILSPVPLLTDMVLLACFAGCCDQHGKVKTPNTALSTTPAVPEPRPVIIRPEFPPMIGIIDEFFLENLPPNYKPSRREDERGVAVPAGVHLLSQGKPVTTSDPDPIGDISMVTDGNKSGEDGWTVLMFGPQWVQIDLGKTCEIHLLWVWYHQFHVMVARDVIARISDDVDFRQGTTVFNNDYHGSTGFGKGTDMCWLDLNTGHAIPVNGVKGRYVRFYANGNWMDNEAKRGGPYHPDPWNEYAEVEIYGR